MARFKQNTKQIAENSVFLQQQRVAMSSSIRKVLKLK